MSIQRLAAASLAALIALLAGSGPVRADTAGSTKTKYTLRIKVGETIEPLGYTPFGKSVSLYTWNWSFRQTDSCSWAVAPA